MNLLTHVAKDCMTIMMQSPLKQSNLMDIRGRIYHYCPGNDIELRNALDTKSLFGNQPILDYFCFFFVPRNKKRTKIHLVMFTTFSILENRTVARE